MVDQQQEVLGEHLPGMSDTLRALTDIALLLLVVVAQHGVLLRHAVEGGDTMIGIVVTIAEVEVEDVNGINLLDNTIVLAYAYLVSDTLSRPEEDALEEIALLGQLHLHNDILAFRGFGLHIYTVGLVLASILIPFALQYLSDGQRLTQKHGDKPLKHFLICLVAKDTLDGPIETYISAILCHAAKINKKIRTAKRFGKIFCFSIPAP